MAGCVCKLLVGTLNIYEADRSKEKIQCRGVRCGDGRRVEIGRDRVSPLMDNDSPKSQIKAQTSASIMFKPHMGL